MHDFLEQPIIIMNLTLVIFYLQEKAKV